MPAQASPGLLLNRRKSLRRGLSERVQIEAAGQLIPGWTLNVSVGGLRAVVENSLDPGIDVMVSFGRGTPRHGRIVWVQDEPDGSIIGVCFMDGTAPRPVVPRA